MSDLLKRRARREAFCPLCNAVPGDPCMSIITGRARSPHHTRVAFLLNLDLEIAALSNNTPTSPAHTSPAGEEPRAGPPGSGHGPSRASADPLTGARDDREQWGA